MVSVDVKHHVYLLTSHQGVSQLGPAVRRYAGKQKDHGSILFLAPFKSCGLWTLFLRLSLTVTEDIKMALIAAHVNAEIILVMTEWR